jgi:hypothetical protein
MDVGDSAAVAAVGSKPVPGLIGVFMSSNTTAPSASRPTQVVSAAQSAVLHPVSSVTSVVRMLPGASAVESVFSGVLNAVSMTSPRARRVAAYTGAGLLGVAGLVEWPVAVAGAAAVWLTQARDKDPAKTGRTVARSGAGDRSGATAGATPKPSDGAAAKKAPAKKTAGRRTTAATSATGRPARKTAAKPPAGAADTSGSRRTTAASARSRGTAKTSASRRRGA